MLIYCRPDRIGHVLFLQQHHLDQVSQNYTVAAVLILLTD